MRFTECRINIFCWLGNRGLESHLNVFVIFIEREDIIHIVPIFLYNDQNANYFMTDFLTMRKSNVVIICFYVGGQRDG